MKRLLHYSVASVLSMALAGQAQAAGTIAGTSVNNQASIAYTVGGVSQPSVSSNTATFVVDRRVNLTVAESGGAATTAAPGATGRVTTFTVTNTTNSTLDFRLEATQKTTGSPTAFADTDNFNMASLAVYVDANGNGTYEVGTDVATYIDELAADATRSVFLVGNIPAGQADGDTAGVTLTATAAAAGTASTLGADMVQTAGADTPGAIDTVFGDGAGDTDAVRDGKHSAGDEYDVSSATIVLVKSSTIISDPHNGTTNPKAIPGAVLEYCIQVRNSGSQAASSVVLTDVIPTNTTFVSNSIYTGGTAPGGVCAADGALEDNDTDNGDESDPNGGSFTGNTVTATLPSVSANSTVTTRFRVTID
jgi:uncharacterized repeat protein (TIGR01451 family)